MFRCPSCKEPIAELKSPKDMSCSACDFNISIHEGVPLLVKDMAQVAKTIADASISEREHWYSEPHTAQWSGPYRHHLQKRKSYVEAVISDYAARVGKGLVGVDLGCGDGENLEWLAPHFRSLYASDYNLTRLLRAKQKSSAEFLFLADNTDYPVCDDAFDVVFMNHVLEHISDDVAALSETYRILKPNGILILGVPNEGAAFWKLAYRLQPKSLATTDHVHFYTKNTALARAESVGLRLLEVKYMGWGVPHWKLDAVLRQFQVVDDLFEVVGQRIIPGQAASLYLVMTK
jgi:SAM-dependent methyltransferase